MSQGLTALQTSQYRRVFDTYCERGNVMSSHEFQVALLHFGPLVGSSEVEGLMRSHGTMTRGLDGEQTPSLNFEQFLNALVEYESFVRNKSKRLKTSLEDIASRCQAAAEWVRSGADSDTPFVFSEQELRELLSTPILSKHLRLTDDETEEIIEDLLTQVYPNGAPLDMDSSQIPVQCFLDGIAHNGLSWIPNQPSPPVLPQQTNATVLLRICHVGNLKHFLRAKRRTAQTLMFRTLDPMVVVRCGNAVVHTTVSINSDQPEWGEDLKLQISVPGTTLMEVQKWVDSHRIYFDVFDYQLGGVVPHLEWISGTSVPLKAALAATIRPAIYHLYLEAPERAHPRVSIDVMITCRDLLEVPVVELFQPPEKYWFDPDRMQNDNFRARLERDLTEFSRPYSKPMGPQLMLPKKGDRNAVTAAAQNELSMLSMGMAKTLPTNGMLELITGVNCASAEALLATFQKDQEISCGDEENRSLGLGVSGQLGADDTSALPISHVINHSLSVYRKVSGKFPRRWFRMSALDENNHFRLLPCFVAPMGLPSRLPSLHTPNSWTVESLAKFVAAIPCNPCDIPCDSTLAWYARPESRSGIDPIDAALELGEPLGLQLDAGNAVTATQLTEVGLGTARKVSNSTLYPSVLTTGLSLVHATPPSHISPVNSILEKRFCSELEHSILLTNCLLSLQLEAYVCIGEGRLEEKTWVIVLTRDPAPASAVRTTRMTRRSGYSNMAPTLGPVTSVDIWDPLKAVCYTLPIRSRVHRRGAEPSKDDMAADKIQAAADLVKKWCPFRKVFTMFNHLNIYFNTQVTDDITHISWDITQSDCWQPLSGGEQPVSINEQVSMARSLRARHFTLTVSQDNGPSSLLSAPGTLLRPNAPPRGPVYLHFRYCYDRDALSSVAQTLLLRDEISLRIASDATSFQARPAEYDSGKAELSGQPTANEMEALAEAQGVSVVPKETRDPVPSPMPTSAEALLLQQLCYRVQVYRKNLLFIPETMFFAPFCKLLNQVLFSSPFEDNVINVLPTPEPSSGSRKRHVKAYNSQKKKSIRQSVINVEAAALIQPGDDNGSDMPPPITANAAKASSEFRRGSKKPTDSAITRHSMRRSAALRNPAMASSSALASMLSEAFKKKAEEGSGGTESTDDKRDKRKTGPLPTVGDSTNLKGDDLVMKRRKSVSDCPTTPTAISGKELTVPTDANTVITAEDAPPKPIEPPDTPQLTTRLSEGRQKEEQNDDEEEAEEVPTHVSALRKMLRDLANAKELPPGHLWYGRYFRFTTDSPEHIFRQLQWSGLLDCSVPNVLYAIAARIVRHPFGVKSTWIFIGYLYDIDKTVH